MKKRYECDELLDYFNGGLTETKQKAFEKHLETCAECREELAEFQMLTEHLPFSAEAVQPNEGMKSRILSAVFEEQAEQETKEQNVKAAKEEKPLAKMKRPQQPKRWLQPLLAASLLLSIGANAYFLLNDRTEVAEPATARVTEAVQLAAAKGFSGKARATVVNENSAASVIVQAEQLRTLKGTEAYQVWFIDESGNKVRAGTFRPDQNGTGAVSHAMPEPPEGSWQMIAVTLEPTPESAQPLGDIVLAAEL